MNEINLKKKNKQDDRWVDSNNFSIRSSSDFDKEFSSILENDLISFDIRDNTLTLEFAVRNYTAKTILNRIQQHWLYYIEHYDSDRNIIMKQSLNVRFASYMISGIRDGFVGSADVLTVKAVYNIEK